MRENKVALCTERHSTISASNRSGWVLAIHGIPLATVSRGASSCRARDQQPTKFAAHSRCCLCIDETCCASGPYSLCINKSDARRRCSISWPWSWPTKCTAKRVHGSRAICLKRRIVAVSAQKVHIARVKGKGQSGFKACCALSYLPDGCSRRNLRPRDVYDSTQTIQLHGCSGRNLRPRYVYDSTRTLQRQVGQHGVSVPLGRLIPNRKQ